VIRPTAMPELCLRLIGWRLRGTATGSLQPCWFRVGGFPGASWARPKTARVCGSSRCLAKRVLGAGLAVALGATSCIGSNVMSSDSRFPPAIAEPHFAPAKDMVLEGLYATVDITGDVASQLRKVYYMFLPDGHYTGAALIDAGGIFAFQTLSGSFSVTAAGLVLDGAEAVPVSVAGDLLRIEAPGGSLVLRREAMR